MRPQVNDIITVSNTAGNYQAVVTGSPFIFGGVVRHPVFRLDTKKRWYVPENLITHIDTEYPLSVGDRVRLPGHGSCKIVSIDQDTVTLKFRRLTKFFGWQTRHTTVIKWRTFV